MDFLYKLLNSPFIALGFLLLIAIGALTINLLKTKRCKTCGKGKMIEVKSQKEKTLYHHVRGSPQGGGHSSLQTIVKVTYMCSNCKDTYETTENR